MNAVERLWRALRRHDWAAARAQLHEHAVIRRPHTGERFDRAADYIAAHRFDTGRRHIDVRETVVQGHSVAVWAVVSGNAGTWHCGGFYELHETRIAVGVELWTPEAPDLPAAADRD